MTTPTTEITTITLRAMRAKLEEAAAIARAAEGLAADGQPGRGRPGGGRISTSPANDGAARPFYGILDMMPKGRNENGPHHSLADWARPRTMYGKGGHVESNGRFHPPGRAAHE